MSENMREIKFRAWDKAKGEWCNTENCGGMLLISFAGRPTYFANTPDNLWHPPYVGELVDLIVINQYTGLKDKNGVEIYEGDICRVSKVSIMDHSDPNPYLRIIKYDENTGGPGQFWVNGEPSTSGWTFLASTIKKYYEVIGNIYENPELLVEIKKIT